ncbi:hypothetical protein P109_gp43 [Pelagibacter phage HTVC109P]|nr:hypothetical protein P109_gp43 [Pelagibacter phage HTVC109P]
MRTLIKAVLEINPDAVTIAEIPQGEVMTYEHIQWLEDTPVIPKDELLAKAEEITLRDAHIEPRKNAYPSFDKQFEMMYDDQVNGTTTWADAIAKVKIDNPKSE